MLSRDFQVGMNFEINKYLITFAAPGRWMNKRSNGGTGAMIKRILAMMAIFSIGLGSAIAAEKMPTAYAQVSSMKTQIPGQGNKYVNMETVDGSMNVMQPSASKLTVQHPGLYFFMAAAQVGARPSATEAKGYVNLWLLKNGQTVPNSTAKQYVCCIETTSVLVTQSLLMLKEKNTISVGCSATKPMLGLIYTPPMGSQPGTPSLIASLFRVGS